MMGLLRWLKRWVKIIFRLGKKSRAIFMHAVAVYECLDLSYTIWACDEASLSAQQACRGLSRSCIAPTSNELWHEAVPPVDAKQILPVSMSVRTILMPPSE